MAKICIWMLYRGGPTEPEQLQSYFQAQMEDPYLLNLGRHFIGRLWMRFLCWWRGKDLRQFQLTGPCPSHSWSTEQSRELNRVLGSDYSCTSVHRYNGTSAADRVKETSRQNTVLLLPLVPFRSGVLYSALAEARKQLQKEGIQYIEAPPLSRISAFCHSYTESIREAIISLNGARNYAVLILISKDALNWKKAEPELVQEVEEFSSEIQRSLHQDVPIITAIQSKTAIQKLNELQNVEHILYGHPDWICDSYESLPAEIASLPFQFHQIPSLNNRPSFIRALAEVVWKHAPVKTGV